MLGAYPQGSFSPLSYKNDGLARFQIEKNGDSSGYVIFTESYIDGWVLDRTNPIPNLGTTSAYPIDGNEKELTLYLQRFNLLIMGYSISGITLAGIIIYYFKDRVVSILTQVKEFHWAERFSTEGRQRDSKQG